MGQSGQVGEVRLASDSQAVAPVTIPEAGGHVLRVVPAAEFLRVARADRQPRWRGWRRDGKRA
jgi:hypothetical protein